MAAEGCKYYVLKEQKTSTSPLPSPTTAPTQASRSKARNQASSIHTNRKQPVYLDTRDKGGELSDFKMLPHCGIRPGR